MPYHLGVDRDHRGPRTLRRELYRAALTLLLTLSMLGVASPGVALTGDEDDLGARALYEETWSTPVLGLGDQTRAAPVYPMTPPVSNVYSPEPRYYTDGCHVRASGTTIIPGCVYGDAGSDVRVAMVGDSKIGRFFPALEEIAHREGWALRTYTKSACAFVDEPTPSYPACDTYNGALRKHLAADPPDIVLTGGMRQDVGPAYVRTWRRLEAQGVRDIVALWDSPSPQDHPAECVADALERGRDLTTCATVLPESESGNPSMQEAAAAVRNAHFISLRDWVCPESALSPRCAPVIGRAQIYGMGSHLATPFAATLTDPLHQRLYETGVASYRPSVDRVWGKDRYETAAKLSADVTPGGRVFVASGRDYPDALAAAAKAGSREKPGAVLLTTPTAVPPATQAALGRLKPSELVLVGGPRQVDDAVLKQLRTYHPGAYRVAGETRYETAAAIAGLAPRATGGTVYVASGEGFADALAAAAQAGQEDSPILLVRQDSIPESTGDALRDLAPERIVVAGGPVPVAEEVVTGLGAFAPVVDRVAGADRYGTAAALADGTASGGTLHVSVGTSYADALAAAPAAAAVGGAVLLVSPTRLPDPTADAVRAVAPRRVVLTGGPVAVRVEVSRSLLRLVR